MTRDDVIKNYLANFNLYKHFLSIDEQIDNHKKFKSYLRKEYPVITKKQDTIKIINYAQLKNIVGSKYNKYNYLFFFVLH